MTFEEYDKTYKKYCLLNRLKYGKDLKRKGISTRILSILLNTLTHSNIRKRSNPYKSIEYNRVIDFLITDNSQYDFSDLIEKKREIIQACIGEFLFFINSNQQVVLFFNQKNVSWARIDFEILQMFPNNCNIQNGFLYMCKIA
jgi:hypothetical protein